MLPWSSLAVLVVERELCEAVIAEDRWGSATCKGPRWLLVDTGGPDRGMGAKDAEPVEGGNGMVDIDAVDVKELVPGVD